MKNMKYRSPDFSSGIYQLSATAIRAWAILSFHQGELVRHEELEKFCFGHVRYHNKRNTAPTSRIIEILRNYLGWNRVLTVRGTGYVLMEDE